MITRLFLAFTLSFFALQSVAQSQNQRSTISVSSSSEVLVPADLVQFSITISITDANADNAYNKHRERESFLANLLEDMDIDRDKITYDPIQIRPNRQRDGEIHTSTQQRINLELSDFDQLNSLQRTLIDNKFDNFSGRFTSSRTEEAEQEALRKAVEKAREDAEILADASGKALGDVHTIEYTTDRPVRTTIGPEMAMRVASDSASMSDFEQMIPVQKRVQVVFNLVRK